MHKGAFLDRVLASMQEHGKQADFVLVIGDDASDEYMFTAAEDYAGACVRAYVFLILCIARPADLLCLEMPREHARFLAHPPPPPPDPISPNPLKPPTAKSPAPVVQAYSCTVGKKPSQARAFLNDVEEVHNLLSSLARCSKVRWALWWILYGAVTDASSIKCVLVSRVSRQRPPVP